MGLVGGLVWLLEVLLAWGERRAREAASSVTRSPCDSGAWLVLGS